MADVTLEILDDNDVVTGVDTSDTSGDVLEISVGGQTIGVGLDLVEFIEVTEIGIGPKGDPGASAVSGGAYHHLQTDPLASWTIEHDLGTYPRLTIFLSSAPTVPVYTDLEYPDSNTIIAIFDSPVSGEAYL